MLQDFGLYIHWPYCVRKCPYCDFNSHVTTSLPEEAYLQAALAELDQLKEWTGFRTLKTIYFGGGTPSLMHPETVAQLIEKAKELYDVDPHIEITLEANPQSVEIEKFRGFQEAGVNRLSLGIQSLEDEALQFLGRPHTAAEGLKAIETAEKIFERYTFDLIYARSHQALSDWERELKRALPLTQGHLSLYQLTIEPNTPFARDHALGRLEIPGEDLSVDFYEKTCQIMEEHGYHAYEVSNYAKPGQASQHNLLYWKSQEWGAVGPGAHGRIHVNGKRHLLRRHRAPEIWMKRAMKGEGHTHLEPLSEETQAEEAVMMGLRLERGIDLQEIHKILGFNLETYLDQENLAFLTEGGFLEGKKDVLRATSKGRLCLNTVCTELLKNPESSLSDL